MKTFKAGPELDVLVARKVMGCKIRPLEHQGQETMLCDCPEVDYRRPHGGIDGYGSPNSEIAPYSTDRAFALELLEKFPGGWLHNHDNTWQAGFDACPWSDRVMPGDKYTEPHETAALAICHAVLQRACMKDCGTCRGEGRIPHRTEKGYTEMCPECHGAKKISDGFLETL